MQAHFKGFYDEVALNMIFLMVRIIRFLLPRMRMGVKL